jgi:hypothetical protein
MRRHPLAFVCGLAALFALSGRPSLATADPPASSSAAPASSGASAADAGAADAAVLPLPAPPFDADPFPTERTPPPKPEEWRAATPVSLTRTIVQKAVPCRAYRVREWMKFHCDHPAPAGLAQIAGPSEGVALFLAPSPKDPGQAPDEPGAWWTPRAMEVIFPLRRGEGHVFQFLEMGAGYSGPEGPVMSMILADQWIDGEAPIITLHKFVIFES